MIAVTLVERGLVTNSRWRLKAMEVNRKNTISSCSSLEKVMLKLPNHTVSLFEQRHLTSSPVSIFYHHTQISVNRDSRWLEIVFGARRLGANYASFHYESLTPKDTLTT